MKMKLLYAQFCHFDEGDPSKANGRSKSHNLRFSRFGNAFPNEILPSSGWKVCGELRAYDNGTVVNLRYPARFKKNLVGIT